MKKVQVIWTDESMGDLEVIYDFIAEKSRKSAKNVVQSILSKTRQLETFPESGSPYETNISIGVSYRFLVQGNYKIIYSIERDALYVEAVVDTRQDPASLRF
ncbi:type II toxin-antitoxin system RelE/ParE family toxin [Cyclobacterium sp. 1_MG-2023]|uniref:type II toxin-antitoxin system RelE/ParE family toxin n=1 Tax=Cyclobacterium sp. 1_MG-2023 TaxID=3062681 RepID=UPI0026E2CED7|nr:type II toxin-antitoxin system RelE/ParE family toxin [Cyclobacterium sp. 1_MG-2023]MDO6438191.1 type II toxin-antitoxin system RelE/ParE family toxin [Cyclobacterium sp. 1_MG-2023]